MSGEHTLSYDAFDALARGDAGADTIGILSEAQRTANYLCLLSLVRDRPGGPSELYGAVQTDQGAGVLAYPFVSQRLYTARSQPENGKGAPGEAISLAANSIFVAAAIRADMAFETSLQVENGMVFVPTIGAARFAADSGSATVRHTNGTTTLHHSGRTVTIPEDSQQADAPHWQGVRRIEVATERHPLRVAIESTLTATALAFRPPNGWMLRNSPL